MYVQRVRFGVPRSGPQVASVKTTTIALIVLGAVSLTGFVSFKPKYDCSLKHLAFLRNTLRNRPSNRTMASSTLKSLSVSYS